MERELSDQEQFRRESLVKLRGMGINPYPAAEYVEIETTNNFIY